MQFVSWDDEPARLLGERKISTAEVSLCFVLGRFFEAVFIDSSESFASLTNCIFKFWSNTTLKLGAVSLYFISVDGHAARFSLQFCHRMTSRHKDWNKCISAFFIFTSRKLSCGHFSLWRFCFLKATLVPNNFKDKPSCVSLCVCVSSKNLTVIWVECFMSDDNEK